MDPPPLLSLDANSEWDQQTNGPSDQWTNGPTDQWTNGPPPGACVCEWKTRPWFLGDGAAIRRAFGVDAAVHEAKFRAAQKELPRVRQDPRRMSTAPALGVCETLQQADNPSQSSQSSGVVRAKRGALLVPRQRYKQCPASTAPLPQSRATRERPASQRATPRIVIERAGSRTSSAGRECRCRIRTRK